MGVFYGRLTMRATIPDRQRSKVIANLLELEILRREKALYECALAVEDDTALKSDMSAWAVTLDDGLNDDTLVAPSVAKESKP